MASSSTSENSSWQIFDKARNITFSIINQSKNVGNIIKNTGNAAGNKWSESSNVTKACIIVPATAVVAPLAILPILSVVGFTSAGVAAGSIAASIQTASTVSGGVFALCQSAAATGVVAASTTAGVSLTAGITVGSITAALFGKKSISQSNAAVTESIPSKI